MASKNKKTSAKKNSAKKAPAKKVSPKKTAHAVAKKPASKPAKKNVPVKKNVAKPAKKSTPKSAVKKSAPAKKSSAKHDKKSIPAKKIALKPAKKPVVKKPIAKKSSPKESAHVPAKKPVAKHEKKAVSTPEVKKPVAKKPEPKKSSSKKAKASKGKSSHPEIVVRRDAETVQTKIITRRRGLTAYTPKELEALFLQRGTKNLNLFDPAVTEKPAEKKPASTKRILKALPKAKPRKVGAVSLNDLFGYNPFAKDSVSAEEKLIPQKWLRYYKKLITLRTAIQKEIDEHSQTAFNRKNKDDADEVSASYSQHTADIDNEAFTRDCALSLLAGKQQELAEINIAIERMKKGTYGICEITGKPIPAERLRDIPFTRYSLEGKIEAEKQRHAAARRYIANAPTDIAAVTDIENDVPIVFNEDDEADTKKGDADPSLPEDSK